MFITSPLEEILSAQSGCCAAEHWVIISHAPVIQLLCVQNSISLPIILAEKSSCKVHHAWTCLLAPPWVLWHGSHLPLLYQKMLLYDTDWGCLSISGQVGVERVKGTGLSQGQFLHC